MGYPRYKNWCTDTMQTQEARDNFAAFIEDGRLPALHDDNHPDHEQAIRDMLMGLDKGDVISRYRLEVDQLKTAIQRDRETHTRETDRLRDTVQAAGRWWNLCIRERNRGRKTVRLDGMDQ